MYEQLLKPKANEATKTAMSEWAQDVSRGIVDQCSKDESSWKLKEYDKTTHELIGSWKRVVFFVKTNFEGEIQDIRFTFVCKIEGKFHVHGGCQAIATMLPEIEQDRQLITTSIQAQDAIVDMTLEMDQFMRTIDAATPEILRDKLVQEVPSLLQYALGCTTIVAIMRPDLRQGHLPM